MKTYKIVHLREIYKFVHLEKVGIMFTDSYVDGVHLEEMYNFVHLSEMAIVVERYTKFVT